MIWYFNVQIITEMSRWPILFLRTKKSMLSAMLSAFGVEAVASEGGQITWRGARASQGGIYPTAVPWVEWIDWNCKSCCLSSLPWCASRGQPQSHVTPLTLAENVPRFPCLADVQQLPDKTDYPVQHDSIQRQLHLNPLEQGQLDSTSDKWIWPSVITLDLRHASVGQAHNHQTGFSHSILIAFVIYVFKATDLTLGEL
jgi:hypothetical protein